MSAMPKTSSLLFRLFSRRKTPSAEANRFPHSLQAKEWRQLADLVAHPAWEAYKKLLEHYGTIRAAKLLTPLPPDQTNIERGAVAALFEIAALPDILISHWKTIEEEQRVRTERGLDDESARRNYDLSWRWGNSLFADDFRHAGGHSDP